mmetsp:Transcript_73674/g.66314  ORF Transcript_73674/g.66314 Transcript_73674/m.66314 type:complete len:202 (-) Transcript_73674:2-607(-)
MRKTFSLPHWNLGLDHRDVYLMEQKILELMTYGVVQIQRLKQLDRMLVYIVLLVVEAVAMQIVIMFSMHTLAKMILILGIGLAVIGLFKVEELKLNYKQQDYQVRIQEESCVAVYQPLRLQKTQLLIPQEILHQIQPMNRQSSLQVTQLLIQQKIPLLIPPKTQRKIRQQILQQNQQLSLQQNRLTILQMTLHKIPLWTQL